MQARIAGRRWAALALLGYSPHGVGEHADRPGDLTGSEPERLEEAFAQDGAGMDRLGSGASNIALGQNHYMAKYG
jgi:hypothetical protein